MRVQKRDGRVEEWNGSKIVSAISKAASEAGEEIQEFCVLLSKIEAKAQGKDIVAVGEVHKYVEDVLMGSRYKKTARAYIEKRSERDSERELNGGLWKAVEGFISQSSDEFIRENANKAATVVSTHRDLLAGIMSKHYAISHILDKEVAEAHLRGVIHQHDLDYSLSPLTNCLLVNYVDMLEKGFKIGDASIEQPKSIGTAATVLTQIAQAVASSTYGGQTNAHIDFGLKPYVEASYKKLKAEQQRWGMPNSWVEEKIEKEVFDAMQSLLYQINSLTTTNGQSPFYTISLGLDTSKFGRMITKNYLKVHMEGIGANKTTPTFPKAIFFLEEGVNMNKEDPNYDLKKLAVECSAKRIYPDYVSVPKNKEITGVKGLPVSPMSCRSFLSCWTDEQGTEVLNSRFNLGVVSINLPYVALDAGKDIQVFWDKLSHYCELSYKAHMDRVERLKGTKAKQNPTLWMQGAIARLDPEQTIDHLFYGGFASISIGYIGLSETVSILCGGENKDFALSVLQFMKNKCEEFRGRSNIGFSVYGTPSESYCNKAAQAVKRDFGQDVIDKTYLTNSFHVPVWETKHPMFKWGYEQGFAEISSGGNIVYVEAPNLSRNLQAYEGLLDYAYHTGMHYFAVNTPVDQCYKCGYEGEFEAHLDGYTCPACGNNEPGTISVLRRVSGYVSAPNSRPFNLAKQAEVMDRKKHVKG